MSRTLGLVFAVVAYAIFFATFLYLIVFVGDFQLGSLSPKTVNSPASTFPFAAAVAVNVGLIALFGVQHSVMARPGFKAAWTKIVPKHVERSIYVLLASLVLMILYRFWQPIAPVVWDLSGTMFGTVLWLLFWAGWGTVLISTFLMSHFELFGLQQTWFYMRGRQAESPRFRTPLLYRLVRHPMMTGFFLAFWAIPTMTAGHLLLAIGMSAYILIALHHEERDLIGMFGRDYEDYKGRVGMLLPRIRNRA